MPDYNSDEPALRSVMSPGRLGRSRRRPAGRRLVRWDGQKIADIRDWMGKLAEHEPGDVVNVGVKRDGEEITLEVTLRGR